jgi:hypothetical protein
MRRSPFLALALGASLTLVAVAGVTAHSGGGGVQLAVEPNSIAAGGVVVLAGQGLEPNSDRVLVLVGPHDTVHLDTVTTDAQGMFSKQLTIPSHLPAGSYELQAIGDETLSVPLSITAAEGAPAALTATGGAADAVVTRSRAPVDMALLIGFVAFAAVVGGLLAWRAERLGGRAHA